MPRVLARSRTRAGGPVVRGWCRDGTGVGTGPGGVAMQLCRLYKVVGSAHRKLFAEWATSQPLLDQDQLKTYRSVTRRRAQETGLAAVVGGRFSPRAITAERAGEARTEAWRRVDAARSGGVQLESRVDLLSNHLTQP